MSDVKDFVKNYKMQKSIDFRESQVAIDPADQKLAEETVDTKLMEYIDSNLDMMSQEKTNVWKINLKKGTLDVTKKEEGLYDATFSDLDGQVADKFENMTRAMLAKNLMLRSIGDLPVAIHPLHPEVAEELEQSEPEAESAKPCVVRIKMGDFEMEIRKSVSEFVKSYKNTEELGMIKKAIRNTLSVDGKTDIQKAKNLLKNWDKHKESLFQAVDGIMRDK